MSVMYSLGVRGTDILSAGDDLSYHSQRGKRIAFFFSPLLSKRHTNRQSKTVKAIAMELLRELFSPRTEYPLRLLLFYLSLFFSISISLRSFWDPGVCWVRSGGAVGSCKGLDGKQTLLIPRVCQPSLRCTLSMQQNEQQTKI